MESGILENLREYFEKREDIAFAFLFGSAVYGKIRKEGDIDIAIYFRPAGDIEWEEFNKRYEGENKIALDLERLLRSEVDLVVLNRARAIVADEILRKGKPIVIKDQGIFLEYFNIISDEAEQVRSWIIENFKEKNF